MKNFAKIKTCKEKETELLTIFRLLTPENRNVLLNQVHLARIAENSAGKAPDSGDSHNGAINGK